MRFLSALLPGVALLSLLTLAPVWAAEGGGAYFEQKVRPILVERCYNCHSGRGGAPQAGLRLDDRAAWLRGGKSGPALRAGDPDGSLLLRAVRHRAGAPAMPPGGKLPDADLAVLAEWVRRGAPGPATPPAGKSTGPHWSFQPLARPALPGVKRSAWCLQPVDPFILAKLEGKGLQPSAAADRRTLIRRVYYDLIGLPPTPEEVRAFLADRRPGAYERVVDRLLASPRYGERWGQHWLDVAHYADTHGYDKDKRRDHAWHYRDWVIQALNRDLPYGEFVRDQLAGDVLRPTDPEGIVATGFLAAGPWDFVGEVELAEGTVEKEKTRLLDRDDLVSTTMSTFCSLTVHCARCHDHKFDPIPQREYYGLQAVFSGVERGDRLLESRGVAERRKALSDRRSALLERQKSLQAQAAAVSNPELARLDQDLAGLKARLTALTTSSITHPSPTNGYHSSISPTPDTTHWVQVDLGMPTPVDTVRLVPARPTDFKDTPGFGFPVRFRVEVGNAPDMRDARVVADHTGADYPNPGEHPYEAKVGGSARYVRITATRLWPRTNDYVFALGEVEVEGGGRLLSAGAAVTALDSIEQGRWSTKYLVDGFDSRTRRLDLTDPAVRTRVAEQERLQTEVRETQHQRDELARTLIPAALQHELAETAAAMREVDAQIGALPAPDRAYAVLPHAPRTVQLLSRGEVEHPQGPVRPGALSCVPGLTAAFSLPAPEDEGARRAALATWITDRKNALAWRSIVNRVWGWHFGKGIVDTPNDFGRNGSPPSHPELLDWLAGWFLEHGQSLKALHRMLVLSAAYRQSSAGNPAYAKVDGDNRLLWRMNRQRLDAEAIRDTLLATSGKLDLTMGGPGFELFRFKDDHSPIYDYSPVEKMDDPRTFRRTVYRFVVRSVPNPFLDCLDAPDPNISTPVRNTTLTSLQALAMMNNPFVTKQAGYLAARLQGMAPDPEGQVRAAFELALGRQPNPDEERLFTAYIRKHGLTNACRMLFNTDEFVFVD